MRQIRVFAMALIFLVVVADTTAAYGQNFSVLYNFGAHPGDPLSPQVSGIIAQGRTATFIARHPWADHLKTVIAVARCLRLRQPGT